jgi:sec-independent protein translocase protein TatB
VFSVSPTEVLTIAVVALLVFGPKRLPEIARKAGKLLSEIRGAASDLKSGLEAEYEDTLEPLKDVRDTMRDAISGVERDIHPMTGAVIPPSSPADAAADTPSDPASGADTSDEDAPEQEQDS